jgi:hypothetical protein
LPANAGVAGDLAISSLSLSLWFSEGQENNLSLGFVVGNFSMSDSILDWSIGPSAGTQSKAMASCKFYITVVVVTPLPYL